MKTFVHCVALLMILWTSPLLADPLNDARDAGQVVETADGYIATSGKQPGEITDLVADINKRRKAAYARIAKGNGLTTEQVGRQSYKKRMPKSSTHGIDSR